MRPGPRRLELPDHVDRAAVASARTTLAAGVGPAVLDLGGVRSWDRDGVAAMTRTLGGPADGLTVVPPRASSFLGVLDAAGLDEILDGLRRGEAPASGRGPSCRAPARGVGPGDSPSRVFRPS